MTSKLERHADQLSALGHPIRLQILRYVVQSGEGGSAAGEIQTHVDLPASTLSHHLKRLTDSGLLISRPEGTFHYYAADYKAFVEKVRAAEAKLGTTRLTEAVARYLFKLMAYKDEYEVARLHTDPAFLAKVNAQFEGDFKLVHHLAPRVPWYHLRAATEAIRAKNPEWVQERRFSLGYLRRSWAKPLIVRAGDHFEMASFGATEPASEAAPARSDTEAAA